MQDLIGDILNTDIHPDRPKTIGQERAMVLTCRAQIEDRMLKIASKKQVAITKMTAESLKAQSKASKAAAILRDQADLESLGVVRGPPTLACSCRNSMCLSNFKSTGAFTPADHAKAILWGGCPSCGVWFCGSVACLKQLQSHRKICNQQQSLAALAGGGT
jgi:hypothetical protein